MLIVVGVNVVSFVMIVGVMLMVFGVVMVSVCLFVGLYVVGCLFIVVFVIWMLFGEWCVNCVWYGDGVVVGELIL